MNDQAGDDPERDRGELGNPGNLGTAKDGIDRNAAKHGNGEDADVKERSKAVLLFVREKRHSRSPPCGLNLADVGIESRGALLWAFAPEVRVVVPDHLSRLQRENVVLRNQDGLAACAGRIDVDRLFNPGNFRREDGRLFRLATAQQRHGCAHAHSR